MKNPIPLYVLLGAILALFVIQLHETRALKAELVGIRKEQLRQPPDARPLPPYAGIPVFITNEPLTVEIEKR